MIDNRYVTVECFEYNGEWFLPFQVSAYDDEDEIIFETPKGSTRYIKTVQKLFDIVEKMIVDYPIVEVMEKIEYSIGGEYLYGQSHTLKHVKIVDIVRGKLDCESVLVYDLNRGTVESFEKSHVVLSNNIPEGYSGNIQVRYYRPRVVFDNGDSTDFSSLYLYRMET